MQCEKLLNGFQVGAEFHPEPLLFRLSYASPHRAVESIEQRLFTPGEINHVPVKTNCCEAVAGPLMTLIPAFQITPFTFLPELYGRFIKRLDIFNSMCQWGAEVRKRQ